MPVVRKKVQKGFTIIPNSTVRDKDLNLKDRGMICYLLSLPDGWEFSIEGLSAMMPKDGKATITSSLNRLEELGYLERSRARGEDGKLGSAIWTIYDRPMRPNPPEATDQDTKKPMLENPTLENRTQINNYNNKEPIIYNQKGIRSNCKNYKSKDITGSDKQKSIRKNNNNRKTQSIYRENSKNEGWDSEINPSSCPDNMATESPVSKQSRKPTMQELSDYCLERQNGIDPEEFYDFYEANGWIQGKGKPIRDWKAAVRTWERRNKQSNTRKQSEKKRGNPFMDMTREGGEIVYEQEPDFETSGNTQSGVSLLLPERRNAGT